MLIRRRSNPTASGQSTTRPHRPGLLAGLTAAAVTLSLLLAPSTSAAPPGPVPAEPATPGTSEEAQQAYLESTERASALNEQALVAGEKEQAAKEQARAAAKNLADKNAAASAARARTAAADDAKTQADKQHRQAAATAAEYQRKVDAFADASFRGARLGSLSALLTADSPEDFLDTATTLDVIADDSQQTLADAATAKESARTARANATTAAASAQEATRRADTAVKDARSAKKKADAAQAAAHAATQDLTRRQQDLRAEAARLAELRDRLTEQEREAALRAAAEARQRAAEQTAAEAEASEQAAAEAAAAEQAAGARANRANRAASPPAAAPTEPSPSDPAPTTTSSPTPEPAVSSAAGQAVQAALSKVGSQYVWGAAGPDAFDCSGLTSWAYAQAGVTIPRTSGGQYGLPTVPMDQLQPGDLITYYSPVSHVAMYIGDGQIVHASTASKPVYVSSVYYGGPNATAHRVIG